MNKTNKAYEKLKNYTLFSPSYETFKGLFWENLDKEKKDIALDLLLRVAYKALTSEGEKFNELLNSVNKENQDYLKSWLDRTYKEKVQNV